MAGIIYPTILRYLQLSILQQLSTSEQVNYLKQIREVKWSATPD